MARELMFTNRETAKFFTPTTQEGQPAHSSLECNKSEENKGTQTLRKNKIWPPKNLISDSGKELCSWTLGKSTTARWIEAKPSQIIVWSSCALSQIHYLDVTKSFSCQEHRLLSYWETINNGKKICTKWSPPCCYLNIGGNLFLWQYCNPVIRLFFL